MEKSYFNIVTRPVEEADAFNKTLSAAIDDGWDLATFNITEKSGRDGKVWAVALMKRVIYTPDWGTDALPEAAAEGVNEQNANN